MRLIKNCFEVPVEWQELFGAKEIKFTLAEVRDFVKWDMYHRPFEPGDLKAWIETYKMLGNAMSKAIGDTRSFPDLNESEDVLEISLDMAAGVWSIIHQPIYRDKIRKYNESLSRFWLVGIYYSNWVAPPNWLVAYYVRRLVDEGLVSTYTTNDTVETRLGSTVVRTVDCNKRMSNLKMSVMK